MATATEDREIWAAIESISARVAKLEGSHVHLATKADIAEVKTLIVEAEGRLETKITQTAGRLDTRITQVEGSVDTKIEAAKAYMTRLMLKIAGAIIASQLTMGALILTAIRLWG